MPELLEIRKGAQTLIGYPALIDAGDAVTVEVFDEPEAAAARHRAGLRRLFALQIKDALKYLEKISLTCKKWRPPSCSWARPQTARAAAHWRNCASKLLPWRWIGLFCWSLYRRRKLISSEGWTKAVAA